MASKTAAAIGSILLVAATAQGIATATPSTKAWVEALATCVPGALLSNCSAALKTANVTISNETSNRIEVPLASPWNSVEVYSDNKANGKISNVKFQLEDDAAVKERKSLLAWLKQNLASATIVHATTVESCGVEHGGPGWRPERAADPEVQLTLDTTSRLLKGSDNAESILMRAKATAVDLCFSMQHGQRNVYIDPVLSPKAMQDFVHAAIFTEKTHPEAPKT